MYTLDKDTLLRPSAEPPGFRVSVSSDWSINDLPNGGYMMALLARAMQSVSSKKKIAIVTANFMARSAPGEALVETDRMALSSQFERYTARLIQNGTETIRAMGTFVDEELACTVNRCEAVPPAIAALEQCVEIPRMARIPLYNQVEVRLDPACAGWLDNRNADRSEFKGWLRCRDGRPYDALALLVAADAFPPAVYASQGLSAWVPTLELSVNIRQLPGTEWLGCWFRTRFITCGLLEEDGELWDQRGELIALSRQIAHYRPLGESI